MRCSVASLCERKAGTAGAVGREAPTAADCFALQRIVQTLPGGWCGAGELCEPQFPRTTPDTAEAHERILRCGWGSEHRLPAAAQRIDDLSTKCRM